MSVMLCIIPDSNVEIVCLSNFEISRMRFPRGHSTGFVAPVFSGKTTGEYSRIVLICACKHLSTAPQKAEHRKQAFAIALLP